VRPARLDSGQTVEGRIPQKASVHMTKKLRGWANSNPYGLGSSARRIRLTNRRKMKVKTVLPAVCRLAERTRRAVVRSPLTKLARMF
jgi:hypothetical protein